MPPHQHDTGCEPTGREPELPGYDKNNAPMLGGARRLWPSISAHLLAEQHRAHRRGDMPRVFTIRRLRARIQARSVREREEARSSGESVRPLADEDAFAEILADRQEVIEELEQCRRWRRPLRTAELQQALAIIDEYVEFWQLRLA
jgi:uncharacterized protein YqeY